MQEINTELIRKCFWDRLAGLLAENGIMTRKQQEDFLEVSKSTLMNWKNKLALPGHSELVRISGLLDCSIDYLINPNVTVKSVSADIQTTVITTGLSEKAVKTLQSCQKEGLAETLNTVSSIIVSDLTPFQMNEGKITAKNIKSGSPVSFGSNGSGVQETGLISAIHRNLEASLAFDKENAVLQTLRKDGNTPEEINAWFEQKRKTYNAQSNLENSGFKMMLVCTTAAAEGQEYHEILKEAYQEGRADDD